MWCCGQRELSAVPMWWCGPANLPADIVNKWQRDLATALNMPAVQESLLSRGVEPVGSTPVEFNKFIQNEMAKWADVIRRANIKPT
jgi:tripartite-type tricarboxylate transporter receptor subunit TctC